MIALGEREQAQASEPGKMDANERRKRAFSLFVNAYDQCRRAAAYLRWNEGDADELLPSLYAGRSVNRQKEATESPAESAAGAQEA